MPKSILNLVADAAILCQLLRARYRAGPDVNATEALSGFERFPQWLSLHSDHTRAVEPFELTTEWEMSEVEEAFPSGL